MKTLEIENGEVEKKKLKTSEIQREVEMEFQCFGNIHWFCQAKKLKWKLKSYMGVIRKRA